jgi:uncharacterized Fe-S cluster protein YjdI
MAAKEYRTGDVVVSFDGDVCIHSEECVRGLPKVFDPKARPWIRPENASAEDLEAAIARCPSGALQFRRMQPSGGPSPSASAPAPSGVKVVVKPNGPYLVQGPVQVVDPAGTVIKEGAVFALCRCGNSTTKPFCDGSHGRLGWRS